MTHNNFEIRAVRPRSRGWTVAIAGLTAGLLVGGRVSADPAAPATPATAVTPASGGPNNSPAAAPDKASAAGATAPTPTPDTLWTQPTLTGNWGGWRDKLANDGFTPFGSWLGEIWGNANGGIRTGMTQNMLLSTGFDADFEKLVGWTGGGFHAELHWEQGQNPATNVGSFNDPSTYASANVVRLYSLYFKQALMKQQLNLRAGQFGADQDFYQTTSAGLFINAGITAPPVLFSQSLANGDSAVAQYPVAAPAAWVQYSPTSVPVYVMAGVYNGDPGPDAVNNHGFKWQTGSSSGVLVVGEAGWNYTVLGRAGTLKLGGYYHSGTFTNWSGTGTTTGTGIYGIYPMVEQTILQSSDGQGGFNPVLTAYAYTGWAGPNNLVIPNFNVSSGVNWHGPIPGRDNDVAGVAVLYTGFSPTYTASAANPNGPGATPSAETDLEFTYQAVLTPWFSIQPDVQIIFNPANAGTRATATVIGTRATVTF